MRIIEKKDYKLFEEEFYKKYMSDRRLKLPGQKYAVRIEAVRPSIPAETCIWISLQIINKLVDLTKENYLAKILRGVYNEIGSTFIIDDLAEMPSFQEFLTYLSKDENYLSVIIILKSIIEILNLPLKGKSLEGYKEAIIKTCKEMIQENKENQNEN